MGKVNIAEKMVVKRWVGKLQDRLWDIVTRCFDWDIIVFLEVDTGLLLGWVICDTEELALDTWVGWTRNMLAVAPLSISTATSRNLSSS